MDLKRLFCGLLILAVILGLAGCHRQRPSASGIQDSGAGDAPVLSPEVTAVPQEGAHGEEDQSKALEEMPTLPPVENLPEAADGAESQPVSGAEEDDYYSIDALLESDEPEFPTYDEPAPEASSSSEVKSIDPNAMRFSSLVDTTLGFTFNYPSDWVNVPGVYTVCYREATEPGDYPARVSITGKQLVHSPEGTVVTDELTAFVRAIYKQYDPDTFQLGTANPQDTFMGKQAYSNTYLAYSGETEVKGFILGCAIKRRLYVFHFRASYEDYTAMEKVMRYMAQSVERVGEE